MKNKNVKFKVDDRVFHERYKEGDIESIDDQNEFAYVVFDNYDDLLEDNMVKVPLCLLIKIT